MNSRASALRRAVRRRRPIACWHLGREQLVVAALVATDDEPALLDCAAVRCAWQTPSAPICAGILELASRGAKNALIHVAAIDAPASADEPAELEVDCDGEVTAYSRDLIEEAAACFRRAQLPLASLRAEPWARSQLLRFLGGADRKGDAKSGLAADPLAAVTVVPECESRATALGPLLAVPIGLALACFGVETQDE
jgi:hypothetical protein